MLMAAVDFFKDSKFPIALESPAESVASQIEVIDGLKAADNGLFFSHKGGEWGM